MICLSHAQCWSWSQNAWKHQVYIYLLLKTIFCNLIIFLFPEEHFCVKLLFAKLANINILHTLFILHFCHISGFQKIKLNLTTVLEFKTKTKKKLEHNIRVIFEDFATVSKFCMQKKSSLKEWPNFTAENYFAIEQVRTRTNTQHVKIICKIMYSILAMN